MTSLVTLILALGLPCLLLASLALHFAWELGVVQGARLTRALLRGPVSLQTLAHRAALPCCTAAHALEVLERERLAQPCPRGPTGRYRLAEDGAPDPRGLEA